MIHGQAFARKVGEDFSVDVDDEHYYISQALAGHEARAFRQCTRKGLWCVAGRPGDQVRSEEAGS